MTKITGISGNKPITPDMGFKARESDLFQKALDKAIQVKKGGPAGTPNNILGEIQAPAPPIIESGFHMLNEKVTRLLDRLDGFASLLNNPEQSLKDMEPLIQSIKDDADHISETIEKEGVTDENLKKISMESVMMATIEYHKFYRGDYI